MSPTGPAPGTSTAEVVEQPHAPGPDEVAAGLVAGKPGLVDERHPGAAPGQHQGGHAAGRPGPDHERRRSARPPGAPSFGEGPTVRACRRQGPPGQRRLAAGSRPDPNRFAQELFTGLPAPLRPAGRGALPRPEPALAPGHGRPRRRRRPRLVLDVATGTAGVALQLARPHARPGRRASTSPRPCCAQGQENVARRRRRPTASSSSPGRAEQLPFPDATFDALTFTYLLRYVADPAATLRELARVVKPGGAGGQPRVPRAAQPVLAGRGGGSTPGSCCPPAGGLTGGRPWFEVGRFLGPNISRALPALSAGRRPSTPGGTPGFVDVGMRADEPRRRARHVGPRRRGPSPTTPARLLRRPARRRGGTGGRSSTRPTPPGTSPTS